MLLRHPLLFATAVFCVCGVAVFYIILCFQSRRPAPRIPRAQARQLALAKQNTLRQRRSETQEETSSDSEDPKDK